MAIDVTQRISVKIKTKEDCNAPLYIKWATAIGHYDYWLFDGNKTFSTNAKAPITFRPYIDEIKNHQNIIEVLRKEGKPKVLLQHDSLTLQERDALDFMLTSVKVQLLTNPDTWQTEGSVWQDVMVLPGTFEKGDAKDKLFTFSCEIDLQPQINLWQ